MTEPADKPDPSAERQRRLGRRWKNSDQGGQPPEPETNEEEKPVPSAVIDPPNTEQETPGPQPRGTVAGKEKLQPYVAKDIAERARNAWWRTRSLDDGYETFSDLIEAAILAQVEALEAQYNGGEPFAPRPKKKLSSGRPIGR